jgi:hypothetical protein
MVYHGNCQIGKIRCIAAIVRSTSTSSGLTRSHCAEPALPAFAGRGAKAGRLQASLQNPEHRLGRTWTALLLQLLLPKFAPCRFQHFEIAPQIGAAKGYPVARFAARVRRERRASKLDPGNSQQFLKSSDIAVENFYRCHPGEPWKKRGNTREIALILGDRSTSIALGEAGAGRIHAGMPEHPIDVKHLPDRLQHQNGGEACRLATSACARHGSGQGWPAAAANCLPSWLDGRHDLLQHRNIAERTRGRN